MTNLAPSQHFPPWLKMAGREVTLETLDEVQAKRFGVFVWSLNRCWHPPKKWIKKERKKVVMNVLAWVFSHQVLALLSISTSAFQVKISCPCKIGELVSELTYMISTPECKKATHRQHRVTFLKLLKFIMLLLHLLLLHQPSTPPHQSSE